MIRQKRIAAIHDISCVGRCSLTVALPILSAAGFDTSVIPTAVLSTHTGEFTDFTYRDLTSDLIPISNHLQSLNLEFDALYSGFLGSYEQIDIVMDIFQKLKNKNTLILVDPVMADNGKLYSTYTEEMAKGMAKLCSVADIIVPNLTEASLLTGIPYKESGYTKEYIEEILKKLSILGAKKIVLTGVSFEDRTLGAACYDSTIGKISYNLSPKLNDFFYGSGDVFASALLASLMHNFTLEESVQIAVDYTHESLRHTVLAHQERRYGVCFERAIPSLLKFLKII